MYRQDETELRTAMERLERWFAKNVDGRFFNGGTPSADGPLGAFLARWNGQRTEDVPFWEAFYLLGAEHVAREKEMMDGLARDGDWPDTWWDPDWTPFATDTTGQLLVLETSTGKVIEFIHDDEHRPEHGETLEGFLASYADELESGRRALRDAYIVDLEEHAASLERAERREAQRAQERGKATRTIVVMGILFVVVLSLLFWLAPG